MNWCNNAGFACVMRKERIMTREELTECINEHGKEVYSFCKWLTCSGQEADELYQDTWLLVVQRQEGLDAAGNVKSYCLSVALRLWKNRKRKYAWRQRIAGTQEWMPLDSALLDAASAESPEEQLLHGERKRLIREAVDELPQRWRTIVLLFYMEDQSIDQIARITGIPAGTVKSRLHHARRALRQKLKDMN